MKISAATARKIPAMYFLALISRLTSSSRRVVSPAAVAATLPVAPPRAVRLRASARTQTLARAAAAVDVALRHPIPIAAAAVAAVTKQFPSQRGGRICACLFFIMLQKNKLRNIPELIK